MKIEIAENLVYSYLKHKEGCRIVQTNWKTSGKWKTTEFEKQQAKQLFEKIKRSASFDGIFKKSSFEQLIKQAEIDVLGLYTTEQSVFGIDVAFHEAGVNYGSVSETALIIMKKILRTVFIMQTYFSNFDRFNSYFVTPKASRAVEEEVNTLLKEANFLISEEMIKIDFISNDRFFSEIIDPVKYSVSNESDTGELFSRAFKLDQLDTRKVKIENSVNPSKKAIPLTDARTQDGMKIGQFVQFQIRKLFEQDLLSPEEIEHLQDKEYSKRVFNQNFEVLRDLEKEILSSDGRKRYYTNERFCGDYYLTSQWVDYHWEPFLLWLHNLNRYDTP